jgi:hypothetical protein
MLARRRAVALALVAWLVSCGGEDLPQQRPLGSIPTDDLIYDHQAAGFTLTFPPSWHDRYDVDARSGPIAAAQWPFAKHAIRFVYKPVEPDQPEPALATLLVYPVAGWNRIGSEPNAPGTVIAERGDDVYVGAVAGSNPFAAGSPDYEAFNAMRLTTGDLKDGLTLR